MDFYLSDSQRQRHASFKRLPGRFAGFFRKSYLLMICIPLILVGCASFKPVIVWDLWGPIPKTSYDEALQTWAAYKGEGKGFLVYGPTKNDDQVELWIDEGDGPEPVGFSIISLTGRMTRMEPVVEREPSRSTDASVLLSALVDTYHWSAALLKKGWGHSRQALRNGYGRLVDFANQVMGR